MIRKRFDEDMLKPSSQQLALDDCSEDILDGLYGDGFENKIDKEKFFQTI